MGRGRSYAMGTMRTRGRDSSGTRHHSGRHCSHSSSRRYRQSSWAPVNKAEKSRTAAKKRRDLECKELDRLAAMLPFPEEVTSKLDKGTVLRLTISYLRMKQYTQKDGDALLQELKASSQEKAHPKLNDSLRVNEGQLMTNALNAFLIFVSKKGLVYCVSEDVYDHLGLRQEEIIGRNILEYIHPDDCKEFGKQFREKPPGRSCSFHALPPMVESGIEDLDDDAQYNIDAVVRERLFYIRMKCHVVRKGTKTRQTGYLLTQWSGKVMLQKTPRTKHDTYTIVGLLAMVRPMQTTPILEIRLDGNMFMSRHDLAMTFTFCDSRILNLVGYEPSELIGKTAYQFHNPLDAIKIHHCHQALIHKGTSVSRYYRFLAKNGDWVWMQTRATIIYNTRNEPQYVVCMNYVIGQDEGRHFLMMEQEVRGVKYTDIRGAIDVTNLSSPPSGHTSSSGYSSEDDQANNAIGGGHLAVTDHTDMDSLPSTPSTHGGDAHDDDMLTAQSHDDGNVNMQHDDIPELCTDDISFDDLVSSDAWLENMQPDLHQIVSNTNKVDGVDMAGILHENYAKGDIDMEDISCDNAQAKGKDFLNSLLTGDATSEPSGDLIGMDAQTTLSSRTWTTTSSSCLTATSLANSQSSPMLHAMERLSPPPVNVNVNPPSRVASTPQLRVLVSGGADGGAAAQSRVSSSQQSLLSTATVITTTTDQGKSYVAIPFNLSGLQWQQSAAASEAQQKQTLFAIPLSLATSQPAVSQSQSQARQTLVAIPMSSAGATKPTAVMQSSQCSTAPSVMQQRNNKRTQMCDESVTSPAAVPQSLCNMVEQDSDDISVKVAKQLLREQLVSSGGALDWLTMSNGNSTGSGSFNIVNNPNSADIDRDCFSGLSRAETRMVSPLQVTSPNSSPLGSPPPLASPPPSSQGVFTNTYCSTPSPMFQQTPPVQPAAPSQQSATEKLAILNSIFDDHRYTNKVNTTTFAPSRQTSTHTTSKARKSSSGSSCSAAGSSSQPTSPSVLKQFLLCKEPLNPNKGSDTVLAEEGMSQLNIGDGAGGSGSTLKRLLTGQMDKKEVHKCEQRLIETRRQSSIGSPSSSSQPSPGRYEDPYSDDISSDDFGTMDLLGMDPVTDLESLWQPSNMDSEFLMSSTELDETLREVTRQDDLLLQHYFNDIS